MEGSLLTLAWVAIVGFAVFMYVLMDGFDLGIGILYPFAPSEEARDVMMNSVAPVWDFNETWLILGGAGLFAAFPIAYAVVLPAMYLPLLLMLIALIFRGVAFEFRFKARSSRHLWNKAFFLGSLLATFAQGVVLGSFIQGIEVEGRNFAGTMLDWLTPFSLFCGVALIAGYALLGSTWLIWRTIGILQDWCFRVARRLLIVVLVLVAAVSLWTPFLDASIAARWFSVPNILLLSPVPLMVGFLAFGLWRALDEGREVLPFAFAMGLFALSYLGLAISLWPVLIPPGITVWQAAAPPETQVFLLIGMAFLIPTILIYTAYSYWVFRGKVTGAIGYH
ncbi:cytochrome d ubiquinol oxidase subunit II [Azospirillum sp. YIM DDC1]|uniref:Cytochrome d ubiquinol oxidase subunit II n=3 Tax=Azospirillum TaxID=191 RepID=A0A4D8Q528_AZOBR|nr:MULTISPECIES: cytochrome d ubiquinol oxidase subunit II [Azospirillum]AWJ91139.1 cytochrome d ubiquinol oxidase subunit II [Azospirillum baldaniorum]MBK3773091.1 cytochrome d ubiquinol oxidase subunit II [Azospirillum brasilense]MBK4718133.1 cytochrome d ubiquinol oxidase subunit II [Azospirillum aestuarii]PNQ95304.1 cytochrome d ubiquinol oxidase subunit II [Azospirillum argentinense]QCO04523.1 cytochrome d ubiquinol oxidase subunit II [Azospirillum argentinense]